MPNNKTGRLIDLVMPSDNMPQSVADTGTIHFEGERFLKSLFLWVLGVIVSMFPLFYVTFGIYIDSGTFQLSIILSNGELTYVCVAMLWVTFTEVIWLREPYSKNIQIICVILLIVLLSIGIFFYTLHYRYFIKVVPTITKDEMLIVADRFKRINTPYIISIISSVPLIYLVTAFIKKDN